MSLVVRSALVSLALLVGCDRAFNLHRQDAAIDAAPDAPATCFTDPAYHSLGNIPESRYASGTQPKPWLEARDECRAVGAHLVVGSYLDAEWTHLTNGNRLANAHWIGITDLAIDGFYDSLTGERVGGAQPPWALNQPAVGTGEDCVVLSGGLLDNVSCDGPHLAACECEVPVTCMPSSSPTRGYMIVPAATTWEGAHTACENLGYRLAVITDSDEDVMLRGMFGGGRVWIDATDRDAEGQWRTRDGCRPYLRWGHGTLTSPEPQGGVNENCAAIIDVGAMELIDANCAAPDYSALCETL